MKEKEKNILPQNEMSLHSIKNISSSQEVNISHTPYLLKYASFFEKSPLFESKIFEKGSIIFDEGSIDTNLYIVKSGKLSVEKYTSQEKTNSKQLAILQAGDFVGEKGLSIDKSIKEARVVCIEKSETFVIDLKQDLKKFLEENPSIGFELLKHMIVETNQRLSEINKLFTSNYELEQTIHSLKNIDLKGIFLLLEKIKSILDIDYILYFEKHPILENFLTLRYDSRVPTKMQDTTFEKEGQFLNLESIYSEVNISVDDQIVINKLNLGNEIFGYILLGREKRSFDGSDKKMIASISNSLSGVLKKYLGDKEEKNKLYISEMKK